jgi:hypothetical protein
LRLSLDIISAKGKMRFLMEMYLKNVSYVHGEQAKNTQKRKPFVFKPTENVQTFWHLAAVNQWEFLK